MTTPAAPKQYEWTPEYCRVCEARIDDLGVAIGKTLCWRCDPSFKPKARSGEAQ